MKLLIIAPHFPPSSMPPSQRVRLILPHMREEGVEPVILTTDPSNRSDTNDPWMLELVGEDFELRTIPAVSKKITSLFKVNDLGLRLLPFLAKHLWLKVNKKEIDFILYLVPPWYILTIAPLTKLINGVPYAIDFIDPWVSESSDKKNWGLKKKLNHAIGKFFEKRACEQASLIFSVSKGISDHLLEKYPKLKAESLLAIPYGVERKDYQLVQKEGKINPIFQITYVGAVWPDAYPVLDALFAAFSKLDFDFRASFIGTSYVRNTGKNTELQRLKEVYGLEDKIEDDPNRVTYKEAIQLQLNADILLLFGGMQAYYAASKLFGMIASGKPFVAFLHRDSFPAEILKKIKFPYLVEYSNEENDQPLNHLEELTSKLMEVYSDFSNFEPFNLENPILQQYTANSMCKQFVSPIKDYLKNELSREAQ